MVNRQIDDIVLHDAPYLGNHLVALAKVSLDRDFIGQLVNRGINKAGPVPAPLAVKQIAEDIVESSVGTPQPSMKKSVTRFLIFGKCWLFGMASSFTVIPILASIATAA